MKKTLGLVSLFAKNHSSFSIHTLMVLLLVLLLPVLCSGQVQIYCCTCQNQSTKFEVQTNTGPFPVDYACQAACSSNGGTYQNKYRNCTQGAGPDACRAHWDPFDGDCKGNNFCRCNATLAVASTNGLEVTVQFNTDNLGSEVNSGGVVRKKDYVDGQIAWGDKTPNTAVLVGTNTRTHKYAAPGTYTINANMKGQFAWTDNNNPGSCSYRCTTRSTAVTVTVTAPENSPPAKEQDSTANKPKPKKSM